MRLGTAPVLLLDDVFSELDPLRSRALLEGLPPGQTLLTTAQPAPPEVVGGQGLRDGGRRPRHDAGDRRMSPEPFHRRDSEPRPLDGSLEALSRRLGLEGAAGVGRLFAGWPEIVGEAMAEHVRPVRIDAIGPGGDRGPPGLGHPGPPTGRHASSTGPRSTPVCGRPARLEVRVQR